MTGGEQSNWVVLRRSREVTWEAREGVSVKYLESWPREVEVDKEAMVRSGHTVKHR